MMPMMSIIAMMATLDRAGHYNSIPAMMSAAVVVEGNRAMSAVMKALTLVIDDSDVPVMMTMVGRDDHVSFSCRSYRRHGKEQRQGAHDHCFHCNISIC
ncbi:hypothetical protein X732_21445 [Mesorhizobium sp. L2C066B000]|nr:hypothetical protein X732_21445 [Mesorhizobium sp. L2C066B000]